MDRVDTLTIQFRETENYFLMFHDVKNDNKEVGKLFLKDGKIDFTGEATDSAKILIDELKRMWIKEKE